MPDSSRDPRPKAVSSKDGGFLPQPDPKSCAVQGWLEDHFKSWDGADIFYRFYSLPGARKTVIMVHGYGEHSGRYEKFPVKMKNLSAQFAVMDQRGMGRSGGERGTAASFEDYLRDLSAFVAHLRERYKIPNQFILLGHSMGGLVALHWAMKNPATVRMLILSAPFLGLRQGGIIRILNRIVTLLLPGFVYKNPVRSKSLSHDPSEIATHRKDPLILRCIAARLISEISKAIEQLRGQPILSVAFPVHLLLAGQERVVDPAASLRFFDRLIAPYKDRVVFEGFFHEIFNERDQQRAFNVLKTIIEDCV